MHSVTSSATMLVGICRWWLICSCIQSKTNVFPFLHITSDFCVSQLTDCSKCRNSFSHWPVRFLSLNSSKLSASILHGLLFSTRKQREILFVYFKILFSFSYFRCRFTCSRCPLMGISEIGEKNTSNVPSCFPKLEKWTIFYFVVEPLNFLAVPIRHLILLRIPCSLLL